MKIIKENNKIIYSIENFAELHIEKYIDVNNKKVPFIVSDIKGIMNILGIHEDIVYISFINTNKQGKGFGSLLINKCIQDNKENIIVLKSEPMFKTQEEYECSLNSGEFDEKLNKLCNFYKKNNFIDISNYVNYELSKSFILNNCLGSKIIEYIAELTIINSILECINYETEGIFGDYKITNDVSSVLIEKEEKYFKVYSQYNLYQTNYKEIFEKLINKLENMGFKSATIEDLNKYNI